MWIIFGVIAIVATIINLYLYRKGRNYHLAMAIGLSFTALTLVADYNMISYWVVMEDWPSLLDVVPTMSKIFIFLTVGSILLNITPVFLELMNKNKSIESVIK